MKNRDVIDNLLANHHLPEIASATQIVAAVRAEFVAVESKLRDLADKHHDAAMLALRFAESQDCGSTDRAAYVAEAAEHFALARRCESSLGYSVEARRIAEEKNLVQALNNPSRVN
jgi:hypothetical protein